MLVADQAQAAVERIAHLARYVADHEEFTLETAIADIPEFDQDCGFRGRAPSLRQVAAHAARIQSADLSYPIILSADGRLMDGGHRIARAWIEGHTEIDAVRFEVDPEPEFIR